jgi:hypothetical protein
MQLDKIVFAIDVFGLLGVDGRGPDGSEPESHAGNVFGSAGAAGDEL